MITETDTQKLEKRFSKIFVKKEEMNNGFKEILKFIGEVRDDIINSLTGQITEVKEDLRDIRNRHQSMLDNHEARISRLEYKQ